MTSEKKPSLLRTKYDENPFASEDGFRVPIKKKSEVIQTEGPASVVVGEEKISVAQIRSIRTVDSDQFVKLFTDQLDRFFDLTPTALRIVTVLIQDIGRMRVGDGDQVYLTEKSVGETLQKHKQKPPSQATYYRALEELIAKGFIAPSSKQPLFFINPAIFFNGDRVRFVQELRRRKTTRRDELEAAGQQTLQLQGGFDITPVDDASMPDPVEAGQGNGEEA